MAAVHKIAPETSEAHPQRGKKTIRRYLGINGFHVCEGMQAELMFCVMEILLSVCIMGLNVYWIQVWPAFSQFCPCKTHIFFGTRQQPKHGSRWQHGLHSAMNAGHYQMQTRKCVAKSFKIHCPSYVEKSWETSSIYLLLPPSVPNVETTAALSVGSRQKRSASTLQALPSKKTSVCT